ncbi:MAG: endopeptidase La [Planctomycetes bacterium]|nr:endopeptidase La [Planctomycetota bacterium]
MNSETLANGDARGWTLPVLPLKNTVLFPYLFIPLSVGRPASRAAVEAALASEDKTLVVVAQRDPTNDAPGIDGLHTIGTRATIKKMARSDEGIEILVLGLERVTLQKLEQTEPYLKARVADLPLPSDHDAETEALHRAVLEQSKKVIELTQPEAHVNVQQIAAQTAGPLHLAYLVSSMLGMDAQKQQELLETASIRQALNTVSDSLAHESKVLELRNQISDKAQTEISKEQREYMLRHQMEDIQKELGDINPEKAEVELLREQLTQAALPDEIRKEAERELRRLERIPPASPENQLTRNYLELILELPWQKATEDRLDMPFAQQVLDEDHYGLEDVKQRIIEHLAVLKLNPKAKAPILCFVGPPGVGKTSLGQSIARAMNRKFERVSLGGMHDEAELRGHRRTYIGAMPGRVIQALRRAEVNNPVVMLDEVDKLGHDFRGDPAAALLEILDPAQNHSFRDNYLDLPFDLSKVFFITTANTLDHVPPALLDRLEILRMSGYSEEEKVEIAKRYIVPRQREEAGLTADQLVIPDETIKRVISRYTREAGVRQMEKSLGRVARKIAVRFAEGKTDPVTVSPADLQDLLGPERVMPEQVRRELPAGVATGLAWTETGGEVLYVEASLLPGSHSLRLTGQLGDVMRESAKTAQSFVWAHADALGIDPRQFRTSGVHIHVPAGAVPKDGPSAGVAMIAALASLYTHTPAPTDLAMTGEITLTGLVLPIGGVKEKVLAARRAGIRRVILPSENAKDLRDLPEQVRKEMTFILVENVHDVLAAVLPASVPAAA